MPLEAILRPEGPWLHPLVATESEACDLLGGLQKARTPRVAGRTIRGLKTRTVPGWFDECAAALQFPYYFGENWDAFDECITDLAWLPADAYVLLVNNSHRLLDAEPAEQLVLLFNSLERAGRELGSPAKGASARPPKAFHVLFQCERAEEPSLRAKLELAKVTSAPFHPPQ